jgi:transcriptional regulator with PAS, ATPase and Fis domain
MYLYQRAVESVDDRAMVALLSHDYPGKNRELEHAIERAVVLCRQTNIEINHLPEDFHHKSGEEAVLTLSQLEKRHILEVLKLCDQSRTKAAALLGIDKATLWRKLKVYDSE